MKQKVFVIGFQKTGTTSLELALQCLGYHVYGGDKNLMKIKDRAQLKDYISDLMRKWDAVQDMPWPLFYEDLYELYPDANYILTYRRPDSWIRSVVRYFASIRIPIHKKIYNVPCAEGYEQTYLNVYNDHNSKVLDFFRDKRNFIVMEPGRNFDYQTLCEFLKIQTIPNEPFPHGRDNSKRKLPNYKWYRDLRSFYWNYKKGY